MTALAGIVYVLGPVVAVVFVLSAVFCGYDE